MTGWQFFVVSFVILLVSGFILFNVYLRWSKNRLVSRFIKNPEKFLNKHCFKYLSEADLERLRSIKNVKG